MTKVLPHAALVLASACVSTPVVAPAPLAFHTSRSAQDATRVAVLALVNVGFRVAQSDSTGFALTATRTATSNGNQDYVRCQFPNGSDAAAKRETTLLITFRAKPTGNESDITIDGKVRTSYPGYQGTAMQVTTNETECVSNGVMEQQLQSAVR